MPERMSEADHKACECYEDFLGLQVRRLRSLWDITSGLARLARGLVLWWRWEHEEDQSK
jgi:hypothetical protein